MHTVPRRFFFIIAGVFGFAAIWIPGQIRAEFVVIKSNFEGIQAGDTFPDIGSIDLEKGQWLRVIHRETGVSSMLSGPYSGRIEDFRTRCSAVSRMLEECDDLPAPRLPIGGKRDRSQKQ